MFIRSTGIQSQQQDAAGCAGPHAEHVRGTDHGAAWTQRCWEDHDAVHADRLAGQTHLHTSKKDINDIS